MADWSNMMRDFVDEIAASVAMIGRDERGQFVVSACNDHFMRMTGGRRSAIKSFPASFDALIPNYARTEFRQKLTDCFESGVARELEQAYDLRDGTHWWRLSLKPIRHAESGVSVLEIMVTGLEITTKMLLTHELEVSTSRFRSVVDAAYDAIITIDQQHCITLFNRAAENLFGYSAEEMLGQPITDLLPERYRPNHSQYVHQFARSPVRSRQMDERNRVYGLHRDGSLLPVEIAISKINVGGLIEFTAVIRDITDRVQLMDLLQKQAVTDELTGLPNRREFTDIVDKLLESDNTLSVFILDIDYFKKINDSYGHDVGDEVLRVLAKVVMSSDCRIGVFARWGGEEFVAALPDSDIGKATAAAEELRLAIEQQNFEHTWRLGKPVPFTVSIGVTERLPGERDLGPLVKRADLALYRAKDNGRNRVEVG
ncbi:sensor domain-containing diguanylate cyclase [Paraburkholderia silvatlantica]|uniref:Diguanylate cyclase (GGDEF)-like protein/PAS domain S-box-containing protein n=1 Tax=Paraburkholderia silvatlantica TaxID=321895 RepID=A0ABR6FJC9_9BURK|nr:diguanylate cyclase [Paraburkholderia silvatlantica]MBB2927537.1 diguanylate cyclase (GGDEF)-like protein/PAS domain S-box-containing protein [Paraburkholderia silvatlantica]PVY36248.1 PAS domain S-box-containing protein/diguanylate cyclase (GGDEF)-like protein [Paraburkholderia silvatlantica]PXW40336.1 PAS domain S-box-containing protein/diguanylate cyclase (GGDEF)-like protein [Paraburkholderia silvatlantica]